MEKGCLVWSVLISFTTLGWQGPRKDFEHRMVVCSNQTCLSISETENLLQFSHTIISRVYRELFEIVSGSLKLRSEELARWVQADIKATVPQITIYYSWGLQNISEHTTRTWCHFCCCMSSYSNLFTLGEVEWKLLMLSWSGLKSYKSLRFMILWGVSGWTRQSVDPFGVDQSGE